MKTKSKSSIKKNEQGIEKTVVELQKQLNISSDKFLSMNEIIELHNKQQANIVKDFTVNSSVNNRL